MPIERLRMRPWLEDIINKKKYPGVEWLDEDQKIFRLPWKHASRNGWQINSDACLFRAWAEHTGKLKNRETPKIWKANFRCALNSLPDMEELRERRLTKGNNAFKVYRIIDKNFEKKKSIGKKCKGIISCEVIGLAQSASLCFWRPGEMEFTSALAAM